MLQEVCDGRGRENQDGSGVGLPQRRSGISPKRNGEFRKDGYCIKILKEKKVKACA